MAGSAPGKDALFGVLLFSEFVWVGYILFDRYNASLKTYGMHTAVLFSAMFAATIIAVHLTKFTSEFVFKGCSALRSPVQMKKFKDQAWQLAIHASMSWCAYSIVKRTTWWSDPGSAYDPCPDKYDHDDDVVLFYVLQLAIWMWTALSCFILEERRKDYVEMMVHHVVTIALVATSLQYNNLSTGVLVLLVHDGSDVVLDLMKMANYLKLEGLRNGFAVELLFIVNTYVSWPYLRLYYFPLVIAKQGWWADYPAKCTVTANHTAIATGFAVLACLHLFWFGLLQRLAIKVLVSGKTPQEAGREGYEGKED